MSGPLDLGKIERRSGSITALQCDDIRALLAALRATRAALVDARELLGRGDWSDQEAVLEQISAVLAQVVDG